MKKALILFPHQLYKFEELPEVDRVYMVEDPLFFGNDSSFPYSVHGAKLILLRASMQRYMVEVLWEAKIEVEYLENHGDLWSAQAVAKAALDGFKHIYVFDPTDSRLEARLAKAQNELGDSAKLEWLESPNFYLKRVEVTQFFEKKKHDFAAFYQWQRERFNILLGPNYKPVGGGWMLETKQRKSIKDIDIEAAPYDKYIKEAYSYIEHRFDHYHDLPQQFVWPTNHAEADRWLEYFIETRLQNYAATAEHLQVDIDWSGRALLSPLLNIGLLSPSQVIEKVLQKHSSKPSTINDVELLVRNILGRREYTRGFYLQNSLDMQSTNYFNNTRSMKPAWTDAATGITPLDILIKKARKNGYLSTEERQLVIGPAMLLTGINPQSVYSWFRDMSIGEFDWTLAPNVYGGSQYSMGTGSMLARPAIVSSAELVKLGVEKGDWQELWDALYHRFIDMHRDKLDKKLVKDHDALKEDAKRILGYRAGDFLAEKTAKS